MNLKPRDSISDFFDPEKEVQAMQKLQKFKFKSQEDVRKEQDHHEMNMQ